MLAIFNLWFKRHIKRDFTQELMKMIFQVNFLTFISFIQKTSK
jgi:hypothetical protein